MSVTCAFVFFFLRNTVCEFMKMYRKECKKLCWPSYMAFGYRSRWSQMTLGKDVLTAGHLARSDDVLQSWCSGEGVTPQAISVRPVNVLCGVKCRDGQKVSL